ncbi:MAG TPA: helix-turn-helix transcriptional regulator [Candidatus Nanoarchaeia archaeon]|nr:helix-turn-helix transcriptional regulator [Candidatus Nanoarchaeia archaeon]
MTRLTLHTADDVRAFIENRRIDYPLSGPQLATRAHCSRQTVYFLERQHSLPRTDTLDALFTALDVSYQYLPSDNVEPIASSSQQLGERLRNLMNYFELSDVIFGWQLGISDAAVRKRERETSWRFESLYCIAMALNVPPISVEY